jgi:hypothetical protein
MTGHSLPRTPIIPLLFVTILAERWWLSNRNGEKVFTPFAIGLTLLCLAFVFWALATPEARAYFGERYE